jgi:hypothetical protein
MIDYCAIAINYSGKMFVDLEIFNALVKTMTHLFKAQKILKNFENFKIKFESNILVVASANITYLLSICWS